MATKKFTDLNIGDTFVIHIIKFAQKVGKSYIRGQIRYVRANVLMKESDIVDRIILDAIHRKYPLAKHIISNESIQNNQKSKYIKPIANKYHLPVCVHIQKNEHLDFANQPAAYTTTELSFPLSLYCDEEYKNNFYNNYEVITFVGDNQFLEIKSIINSTLINFSSFFS